MKAVKVAGMFNVTLDVLDHRGVSLPDISSTTNGARNVVTITNICTLPKEVRVKVLLPNRTRRIEFIISGSSDESWEDETGQIPNKGTNALECSLERNSGPARNNEPIELHSLSSRPGPSQSFTPVASPKIPFRITINAV